MKNLPLCIAFLCFLFSCSTGSDFEISEDLKNETRPIENKISFPLNKANPFDAQGRKYYDAIQLYLKNNKNPNSSEEITNQLGFISNFYNSNLTHKSSSLVITHEQVLLILSDPSNRLLEVVESCSISTESKAELLVFVQTLIARQNEQYSEIRDFIIAFDDAIIANTQINDDEKESILTVTSISSYALYAEYERKDRDWENSAGTRKLDVFFAPNEAPIVSVIALLNQIM